MVNEVLEEVLANPEGGKTKGKAGTPRKRRDGTEVQTAGPGLDFTDQRRVKMFGREEWRLQYSWAD